MQLNENEIGDANVNTHVNANANANAKAKASECECENAQEDRSANIPVLEVSILECTRVHCVHSGPQVSSTGSMLHACVECLECHGMPAPVSAVSDAG